MVVETEISSKGREDHHLQAVWFAAGTAAFMACLERAVVAHWRVWVFLTLNLLLLAILFTSTKCRAPETDQESTVCVELEIEKKRRKKQCKPLVQKKNENVTNTVKLPKTESCVREQYEVTSFADEGEEEKKESENEQQQLTKEELNERVEAFIAMFRQHLISDAKRNSNYNNYTCRFRSQSRQRFPAGHRTGKL